MLRDSAGCGTMERRDAAGCGGMRRDGREEQNKPRKHGVNTLSFTSFTIFSRAPFFIRFLIENLCSLYTIKNFFCLIL